MRLLSPHLISLRAESLLTPYNFGYPIRELTHIEETKSTEAIQS